MVRRFSSVAVFCGSSNDVAERYLQLARDVGTALAQRSITVVYGGGNVGLMGALADGTLSAGGKIYGVIPDKLMDLELGHQAISELYVVPDMHTRKTRMAALSDAFIALPGGWGTLEEIFEATTWTQLAYHDKPVGLLNAFGYYDHLVAFLQHAVAEGFIRARYRDLINIAPDVDKLLNALATCSLPPLDANALTQR